MKSLDLKPPVCTLAMALLLASCGGEGSPPAATPTMPTAPATKAPNDLPRPGSDATMDTPYERNAVRGDVLATALTQMAAPPKDGKAPTIRMFVGDVQNGLSPYQNARALFLENLIGPDNTGKALGTYVSDWHMFDEQPYDLESMRLQMGLSHAGPLARGVASQGNVPVLTLGKKFQVIFEPNEGKTLAPAGPFMLEAPEPLTILSRSRYGREQLSIMEWTDPATRSKVVLHHKFPFLNDPPNAFTICLNVHGFGKSCPYCLLPKFSRKVCSSWLVPEGWQAGQPLIPRRLETEIQSEYTRFDSNGLPYDQVITTDFRITAGVSPFDDSVHTDKLPTQAKVALSWQGVSGALFATMLDSRTRRTIDAIPTEVSEALFPSALHNGQRLTEALPPQRVYMRMHSEVSRYADGQHDKAPGYSPAAGWLFVEQESKRAWGPDGEGGFFPVTGVRLFGEIRPVDGKDGVVLSLGVKATIPSSSKAIGAYPIGSVGLKTPNEKFLAVSRDALVRFGTVRTWTGETWGAENRLTVRLLLLPVLRRNQVDFCWHFDYAARHEQDRLNRLSCLRWEVPKDWQYGQGLKAIGAYVLDRQPNGSPGQPWRLWRSKASGHGAAGTTDMEAASLPTSIPAL